MLFASLLRSFIGYVMNGMTIIVVTCVTIMLVGGPIYLYWRHLHRDPVHETPGYIFLNDLDHLGRWIGVGVFVLAILFLIGYFAPYVIKF